MAVSDWSTSAGSNTTISGIAIAPGMARSDVDNAIRALMAEAKAEFNALENAVSVLDHIPEIHHAAIAARTLTGTNLKTYFDAAGAASVTSNRPLYVPRGTYPMTTWSPVAGLTVLTDGTETEFKQIDSAGAPQRFIRVLVDGVELWPGGAATINGAMTAVATYGLPGVNATSFNSGIQVYADTGVTINSFAVGDIYGLNIGGDVIETGAAPTGVLKSVNIGTVYADNVYRNGVSITAGATGRIDAVIQLTGIGYLALDFEPDASSGSPVENWTVGIVRGHRVAFSGQPSAPAGMIKVDQLYLDYTAFGASSPAFDYGGVSAATQPVAFGTAVQYRNFDTIHIGQCYIANHPQAAITDASSAPDVYTKLVRIGYLELHQCDAGTGRSITQQKTYEFSIGYVLADDKSNNTYPVIDAATVSDSWVRIEAGKINGRITNGHTGNIYVGPLLVDGKLTQIFRNIVGKVIVDGLTVSGNAFTIFDTVTTIPECRNATFNFAGGALASGGAANAHLIGCTVNGVTYADGWGIAPAAIASAATIAIPKTGDVYSVSGTTNITAITADAGHAGRTVKLVFQGALTFTDGSNLKLAGNFVTTADDTITIATPDGTTWYEVARSVN